MQHETLFFPALSSFSNGSKANRRTGLGTQKKKYHRIPAPGRIDDSERNGIWLICQDTDSWGFVNTFFSNTWTGLFPLPGLFIRPEKGEKKSSLVAIKGLSRAGLCRKAG
jgi:hypothetical protein